MLCPKVRTARSQERICTYVGDYETGAYVPYWGRALGVGLALLVAWIGIATIVLVGVLWVASLGRQPATEGPRATQRVASREAVAPEPERTHSTPAQSESQQPLTPQLAAAVLPDTLPPSDDAPKSAENPRDREAPDSLGRTEVAPAKPQDDEASTQVPPVTGSADRKPPSEDHRHDPHPSRSQAAAEIVAPEPADEADEERQEPVAGIENEKARTDPVPEPVKEEPQRTGRETPEAPRASYPSAATLDGVPRGEGNSNPYARGASILFESVDTPAAYDEVMGLTGLAFIMQAQRGQPRVDGAVPVGRWPLASWGFRQRLDFLGKALGRTIHEIEGDPDAYQADAGKHYCERFQLAVKESIADGKPLLALHDGCFVVRGYDDRELPLLGNWSCANDTDDIRIPGYPWGLIALGGKRQSMPPAEADREALRYAIALFRDEGPQGTTAVPSKESSDHSTGRRSFELWADALRDTRHPGQAQWHANLVVHFRVNRRSAVAYLRAMAKRYPETVARPLNAAADLYRKELALLYGADTSRTALIVRPAGREELARLVERLVRTESEAVAAIEGALAAGLGAGTMPVQGLR